MFPPPWPPAGICFHTGTPTCERKGSEDAIDMLAFYGIRGLRSVELSRRLPANRFGAGDRYMQWVVYSVRCAGLRGLVFRQRAGLLSLSAFVLRERLGRVLRREGFPQVVYSSQDLLRSGAV